MRGVMRTSPSGLSSLPAPARLFFNFVARLPLPVIHGLGFIFGVIAVSLRPRLRREIRDNLRAAGLDKDFMWLRVGAELGKTLAEVLPIWLRPLNQALYWIRRCEGWEHVEAAIARGKGVVVLSPHLGCQELAGLYFAPRFPTVALYRPPREAWAHTLMKHGRQKCLGRIVEPNAQGVRTLLKSLRRNEFVFILPDQTANTGEGEWLPFFKRYAFMPILPYRLLQATDATPLLVYCERLPWGRGYHMHIEAVADLPKDTAAAGRTMNAKIEAAIERLPTQYLWNYRLFRVPGAAPPPPAPL